MDQKLDYLHNNPVVDGIVDNPEDYVYSSARDYCGIKGLIDIELLCGTNDKAQADACASWVGKQQ